MPYNSAMTAVLKCNNCAKSGREASSIMMYLARYAAKRGLEARSAEVEARSAEVEARSRLVHYSLSQRRRALALALTRLSVHYVPASRIRAVRLVHESNIQVQP
tara:strand:- start:29 stop:340 length:312 start_codon:yes stop_codon:yes gene_type:complete